jgi:hypothetical protein
MYFAVLWKNKELSLKELEYASPINLRFSSNQKIVQFDDVDEDKLNNIAWIVKWGKIIQQDLSDFFHDSDKKILWVSDKQQGITLKKKYWLKRFKQVDLFHTDLEIKNKWVELVKVWSQWGEVFWYQNIKLYEVVDFQKPGRSMQMWMMPAKLTHSLINVWLMISWENPLIYDPFVWSWTTWFLANYYWYDFIGTDLKLTFAEKNIPRWMNTWLQTDGKLFDFFIHDATKEFTSDEKEKFWWRVPLVITEGWLWPIIKMNTTAEQVKEYQRWVKNVYLPWVWEMATSFEKKPVMVFTIPWYLWYENLLEQQLIEKSEEVWFQYNSLQEMYKRDQHKVARKIVILK